MESMPMSIQPSISPTAEQIAELRFAASKMHGAERRAFVAQIALKILRCGPNGDVFVIPLHVP
jgi:hypothetical protein